MNVDIGRSVRFVALAAIAGGATVLASPGTADSSAAQYCRGEQLAEGSNWSVCWEIRANEGLAISHAFYTADAFDRRVLSEATVAQVFVPFEAGQPRYHDVAYGLGLHLQRLDAETDCPGGTLLADGRVCSVVQDRGLSERFCASGACATRRGSQLVLLASSQMGSYNYLIRWSFRDDGTIEPALGVTGSLPIGDMAHSHNVYWRLDLDIDGPEDDVVEEFYRLRAAGSDGSAGVHGWAPLLAETSRPDDLVTFRKWRVRDAVSTNARGLPRSYELVPAMNNGSLRTNEAEGFSRGELWVTRNKSEERFVSTDTTDLLSGYVDGDDIGGQDVVLWYAMHEYHEVRSEDRDLIPVEWMSFELRPRDFFDANPGM